MPIYSIPDNGIHAKRRFAATQCLLRLSACVALALSAACASIQSVVMDLSSSGCGGRTTVSAFDVKSSYQWQKDGRLFISANLPESGFIGVKSASARIQVKGNLITITYETYKPETEANTLPIMCNWMTPATFVVTGLESADNYLLIIGAEERGKFRVQYSISVIDPEIDEAIRRTPNRN